MRPQHQLRLATGGDAGQALAHVGLGGTGRDARVRIDDGARRPAGQGEVLDGAGGARGAMREAHLVFQCRVGRQQQAGAAGHRTFGLQRDHVALQVVAAARGDQRLCVVRIAAEPGVHVVRDVVCSTRRGDAQVLQRRAVAQHDVGLQVLHDRLLAGHRLAVVRLDQHAVHAREHLDHQHRRFDGSARLMAQLQPDGFTRSALGARGAADAQPQAMPAQRTVRPGKGCGVALGSIIRIVRNACTQRRRQAGPQLGALQGVACVEPAGVDPALRAVADRVQRPAGPRERVGFTARRCSSALVTQPDGRVRRR